MTQQRRADTVAALNKLGKWRSALTGRILGTRAKGDPESDGFRDLFDKLLILRVEVTALTGILLRKGVITQDEYLRAVEEEAFTLDKMYEQQMPGFSTTEEGLTLDIQQATQTMREQGWPE